MTRTLVAALTALPLVFGACSSQAPEGDLEPRQLPLVNGQLEGGWPAVGALTFEFPGYGYQGSFCSGTLIAPQWVLTAAHCLEEHEDFELSPNIVMFYVGNDARPNFVTGWPDAGLLVQADAFVIHPEYSPDDPDGGYDIGLVHLAEPATDVQPLPLSNSAITGSWIGEQIFYVGFGATEGIDATGGGQKRSGQAPLAGFVDLEYYTEFGDVGVCFGDSGGPGLRELGGEWRVVGVNSRTGGGDGNDPCEGTSAQTRVDAFGAWIAGHLDAPPPNCNQLTEMCACDGACKADGTCDNSQCQVLGCEEIYGCLSQCGNDQGCATDCYLTGTDVGKEQVDAVLQCLGEHCEGVTDEEFGPCVSDHCGPELDVCFPIGTGPASCEETYGCMVDCGSDNTCSFACYEAGTAAAQGQIDALLDCFSTQCAGITDPAEFSQCAGTSCATQLDACFPPADCDLTGGDCDADEACYPGFGGVNDCLPSAGGAGGTSCDATDNTQLLCGDGLLCINIAGGTCTPMCLADGDCTADEYCFKPIFTDFEEVGVCLCTDADNDGWCAADDCDDGNPGANPGLGEACDDVDNDCDGGTDEGCPTCTDGDSDGYCEDVDCNDGDASVSPGKGESCGNDVDDDCDGATDEDCDTCTDADLDTYCDDVDCNDGSAAVNPGAPEACDDGVDNDCDGDTDEGCEEPACTDADGDGACAEVDCNDLDAERSPALAELCGDAKDNDCDGTVDEECDTCVDADGDGYCADVDCNDSVAVMNPGLDEICANGLDDDCDGDIDESCGDGGEGGGGAGEPDGGGHDGTGDGAGDGAGDGTGAGDGGGGTTGFPIDDTPSTGGGDVPTGGSGSGGTQSSSGGCASGPSLPGGLAWPVLLALIALVRRQRTA